MDSSVEVQGNGGILTGFRSGYRVASPLLDSLVEKGLALFLILLSAPLFPLLALLIKLQDGGAVFYRSQRLGKDKVPFTMYKFRTLVEGAEQRVGGELLNRHHRLEIPFGRIIRDVRLDELPQLVNVLKGDMAFFGPRPERPAVYEAQCQQIPGYDKRFAVRPGLLGYSQLYTPHGSPKKLRKLVDNIYLQRPQNILYNVELVLAAFWLLGVRGVEKIRRSIWHRAIMRRTLGRQAEQRTMERIRPQGVCLHVATGAVPQSPTAAAPGCPAAPAGAEGMALPDTLIDLNDEYMLVYSRRPLEGGLAIRLDIRVPPRHGRLEKRKRAYCTGEVVRVSKREGEEIRFVHLITYRSISPLNQYVLDKYFIRKSIF